MASKRWSTAAVGFVGVAALAVGLAAQAVKALIISHKKAEIRVTQRLTDGTYMCQQYSGDSWGSLNPYKFPALDSGLLGDRIRWRGKDLSGHRAPVKVHFGTSPFDQPGYDDDVETSIPHPGAGDYSFDTVTVGGIPCSQYVDPGVHVNQ